MKTKPEIFNCFKKVYRSIIFWGMVVFFFIFRVIYYFVIHHGNFSELIFVSTGFSLTIFILYSFKCLLTKDYFSSFIDESDIDYAGKNKFRMSLRYFTYPRHTGKKAIPGRSLRQWKLMNHSENNNREHE